MTICKHWIFVYNILYFYHNYYEFVILFLINIFRGFSVWQLTTSWKSWLPSSVLLTNSWLGPDEGVPQGGAAVHHLVSHLVVRRGGGGRQHKPLPFHYQPTMSWSSWPSTFWNRKSMKKILNIIYETIRRNSWNRFKKS